MQCCTPQCNFYSTGDKELKSDSVIVFHDLLSKKEKWGLTVLIIIDDVIIIQTLQIFNCQSIKVHQAHHWRRITEQNQCEDRENSTSVEKEETFCKIGFSSPRTPESDKVILYNLYSIIPTFDEILADAKSLISLDQRIIKNDRYRVEVLPKFLN